MIETIQRLRQEWVLRKPSCGPSGCSAPSKGVFIQSSQGILALAWLCQKMDGPNAGATYYEYVQPDELPYA